MNRLTIVSLLVSASFVSLVGEAAANDADKAACADLMNGDDCVRKDGDAGTCQPDESDPNVLTCEDGPAGTSGGSTGTDDSPGGENEIACDGLDLGDACVRADGDAGTCVPDQSDPDVLECEDDSSSDSDSSDDSSSDSDSSNDDSSDGSSDDSSDDNKVACEMLDEGDACVRADGDAGTCVPDDSDPDVLECEDEASASSSSNSNSNSNSSDSSADDSDPMDVSFSCSVGRESSAPAVLSLLLLAGLGARRRRTTLSRA